MQNKKTLTSAFRSLFRKGADQQQKELFAHWFTRLDLSNGQVFRDSTEELELEKRMEDNLYAFFHQPPRKKVRRLSYRLPAAAAAVLLLAAGCWWLVHRPQPKQEIVFSEVLTAAGQRKLITLADGSVITLNNASHLRFPKVFSDTLREVYLDGEAFFNIAPNEKKPFTVHSGELDIHVLGTSFNVQHYEADQQIQVVVSTGKVGIYAKNDTRTWILTPGDMLAYDRTTKTATAHQVLTGDYTGWQTGELVFDNETLENICKRLERWYGVTITIRTVSLKSRRINLKQKNESLQTIMKMLGMAGGFDYEIKGNTVSIR